MRCPKCGYISFDHLDNCLKCNREFKGMSGVIEGTVFKVQAPSFLKMQMEPEKKSFGDIEIDGDVESGEFDLTDPDLEILLDEDADEASEMSSSMQFGKDAGAGEISSGDAFELSMDTAKEEEEEGLSIDLGQFQNDLDDGNAGFDDIFSGKQNEKKMKLDFPEELGDMSDLSPPHQKVVPPPIRKTASPAGELDDLNMDLNLDGLNKATLAVPKEKKTAGKAAAILSLDEIDLSTVVKPGSIARKSEPDAMNMDEELNFDLDLGGLSIHKD